MPVPVFTAYAKFTGAFFTMLPALTDTTSSRLVSNPSLKSQLPMLVAGTSAKLTGIVTSSPDLPSPVPIITSRASGTTTSSGFMVTLPGVNSASTAFKSLSANAPTDFKVTGVVVLAATLFSLKVMFANTPSLVISSLPMVLSRNRKLIVPVPVFTADAKFTGAFFTMLPALTDTTSSRLVSNPSLKSQLPMLVAGTPAKLTGMVTSSPGLPSPVPIVTFNTSPLGVVSIMLITSVAVFPALNVNVRVCAVPAANLLR